MCHDACTDPSTHRRGCTRCRVKAYACDGAEQDLRPPPPAQSLLRLRRASWQCAPKKCSVTSKRTRYTASTAAPRRHALRPPLIATLRRSGRSWRQLSRSACWEGLTKPASAGKLHTSTPCLRQAGAAPTARVCRLAAACSPSAPLCPSQGILPLSLQQASKHTPRAARWPTSTPPPLPGWR